MFKLTASIKRGQNANALIFSAVRLKSLKACTGRVDMHIGKETPRSKPISWCVGCETKLMHFNSILLLWSKHRERNCLVWRKIQSQGAPRRNNVNLYALCKSFSWEGEDMCLWCDIQTHLSPCRYLLLSSSNSKPFPSCHLSNSTANVA